MSGKSAVRDGQHGTITGYTYGCRCEPCRQAKRDYSATRDDDVLGANGLAALLDAIGREADLDGLCTSSSERLAEVSGLSHTSVKWGIHRLAHDRRLRIGGRRGRGGSLEIYIEEIA